MPYIDQFGRKRDGSVDPMRAALEADGEKLRQLTGEDHGPFELPATEFWCSDCDNDLAAKDLDADGRCPCGSGRVLKMV